MFRGIFSVVLVFLLSTVLVSAAPNPIAYFTFDELSNVIEDASGNGHDGTPKGDIKLSNDAKVGKSFEFNGLNAYVDIERIVQDDFTLMTWMKTSTKGAELGARGYQGSGIIWSDVAGATNDFILAILGMKLSFFCGNPDLSVNSVQDVVTGEWIHVAGVRSQTDQKIGIYINGKHEKTMDHANKVALDAQPRIHIGGNTLDTRYYTGLLDEVKLFDTALTEEEIQGALATAPVEAMGKLSTKWGALKATYSIQ